MRSSSLSDDPPQFSFTRISEYGIAFAAMMLAGSAVWYVVSRLNIGIDVSDSAYYIISYAQHHDIESQSTLAGWLWASLSPFRGVLPNRYFGAAFLIICFAMLALESWRIGSDKWMDPIVSVAFAAAGSLVYYVHWFPDPSYNSINLGFIALGWLGVFGLLHAASENVFVRPSEAGWALLVGIAVASVFLAKPTSAALFGPALLMIYLATSWRHLSLRRTFILALIALFGLAVPFIALVGIGEPPLRVFTTLKNGVEAGFKIAPPPLNPLDPLITYLKSIVSAPVFKQWFTWVAVIAVAITSSNRLSAVFRVSPLLRRCVSVAVAIGFPILAWRTGLFAWADRGINGLLILVLALAVRGSFLTSPDRRSLLAIILGAMILSPAIYVFGTGSAWEFLIPTATGFACAALGIVISSLPESSRFFIAVPGLSLMATLLGGAAVGIEWSPYRVSAPLSANQSLAHVGPYNEVFLESPTQATFYNKLAEVRPIVEKLPERPYLIDLSGRVPMVTFQIGARAPRTPWLLSGYPGSTELFHLIVGKIPRNALRHAWIFQAHGYDKQFPDKILRSYGLDFLPTMFPSQRCRYSISASREPSMLQHSL